MVIAFPRLLDVRRLPRQYNGEQCPERFTAGQVTSPLRVSTAGGDSIIDYFSYFRAGGPAELRVRSTFRKHPPTPRCYVFEYADVLATPTFVLKLGQISDHGDPQSRLDFEKPYKHSRQSYQLRSTYSSIICMKRSQRNEKDLTVPRSDAEWPELRKPLTSSSQPV